jgi:hypothetical protein
MRLVTGAAFLLAVISQVAPGQQPTKAVPKDYVKRCGPDLLKHTARRKPQPPIQIHKGEKSAGYPPIITFEISESG